MADVRYQVPGVPPAPAAGITAFAPAFVRHAASSAQSYKYAVHGSPGVEPIPMEARQNTQISPDYGDLAQAGGARSSDAPDAIYPQLYYQRYAAEWPGGPDYQNTAVYEPTMPGHTTLLPVPAEDGRAVYQEQSARLARVAITNRQGAMPFPARIFNIREGTWFGRSMSERGEQGG